MFCIHLRRQVHSESAQVGANSAANPLPCQTRQYTLSGHGSFHIYTSLLLYDFNAIEDI